MQQCTDVRLVSFLSGEFITVIVVNAPERKLAKRTSVQWCGTCLNLCALAEQSLRTLMKVSSACAITQAARLSSWLHQFFIDHHQHEVLHLAFYVSL